ncbi:MAG TPA: hypothetical protein VKB86_16295, partial [Pyrinomonadaceae bacterium]|nr:hypothetical protein [Pyrinomonadaceae bacterium]
MNRRINSTAIGYDTPAWDLLNVLRHSMKIVIFVATVGGVARLIFRGNQQHATDSKGDEMS